MATAPMRIYIVTDGANNGRLVKAQNPSQALAHVASSTFTVRKATPEDSFEAAKAGKEIENYKETAQAEMEI
jgi:hypothetical protein